MSGSKGHLKSKTIAGAIVALLLWLDRLFLGGTALESVGVPKAELVNAVATVVSFLVIIIGRSLAQKPLKGLW